MTAAQLTGVTYAYPRQERMTLAAVDWSIAEGEFVLLAGPSGSGKSTLLRCLNGLVPHFSGGSFGGTVVVNGHDTRNYPPRALARSVGFVFQDPEAQFVTSRVDDEIAFGMEQLGVPVVTMRKRVEEMLDLLGIAALRERDVATLSGGERQRVAVAAALALHPAILALDEPTSQLDPWGADEVLTALTRLNDDLGLTIALAEHRLDRVLAYADRVRLLDRSGAVAADAPPREALAAMDPHALPPLARLGLRLGWDPLPLTIKEGRARVAADAAAGRVPPLPPADPGPAGGAPVIQVGRLNAGFGRRRVLRDVDFEVRPGELVALMGRNGSGKTTLLRTLLGLHAPDSGRVTVLGRDVTRTSPAELATGVGYVPQNPSSMLFAETLRDELAFTLRHHPGGADPEETLDALGLLHAIDRHPRDLSGGERERAALAAILVGSPRVLLLDEPTRGMDADARQALTVTLERLRREGTAIVMATHDVELVAATATRVAIIGDGQTIADGGPRAVLSGSLSFATQINKLYGGGFLTVEDAAGALAPEPVGAIGHDGSDRA
jgi:energy-coupling factor transport system ATP-binding protein